MKNFLNFVSLSAFAEGCRVFWCSTLCNVSPHSRHLGGNLFSLLPQAMAISTDWWVVGGGCQWAVGVVGR